MAATIILPKDIGEAGMNTTVQGLFGGTGNLDEILQGTWDHGDVDIDLPSFKVDAGAMNLNKILQEMGMDLAFKQEAEFTRMTAEKTMIGQVLHKAVIAVDEEGTTAAAVTVSCLHTLRHKNVHNNSH